jgi:hypothetical protein
VLKSPLGLFGVKWDQVIFNDYLDAMRMITVFLALMLGKPLEVLIIEVHLDTVVCAKGIGGISFDRI